MKRLLLVLASAAILTACSDDAGKQEIKSILECSMAAKLVGQTDKIDIISNHANWASAKSGYQPSIADAKQMHDEIKAKWNLRSLPRADQDALLVGIYNSDHCAKLHEGAAITVNDVPPDA
ncbi:hypothetical protein [Pseudomonas sp. TH15]|uniref:hypothetical protein n=1 Tax=Pseudomonas sp. TH15 TaxID=2796381 RepID=UPI0019115629|nr:hypothetical protein [Pseudomonas sp. TH15]MBK5512456.1 hypothetical protein [Pseudomonas sp. TH15]